MSDNFFANVDTNLEQEEDFLGGNYDVLPSDIYPITIKVAYLTKSPKGSSALNIEFIPDGQNTSRTITTYMTKATGENFYVKDGKKRMMPGWALAESISMMVEEKGLLQALRQEKQVELWNAEAKKRLPTSVPVLVNWSGKRVYLGILNELSNKFTNGAYTAETVNRNIIDKAFHIKNKKTLSEALKKEPATFFDEWEKRNKDAVRDVTKKDLPNNTAPSSSPSASAPEASQVASDLFS